MSPITKLATRNQLACRANTPLLPTRRSVLNRQTRTLWFWHRERGGWPSHDDTRRSQKALRAQKLFLFKCLTTWGRSPFWNRVHRHSRFHWETVSSFGKHSPGIQCTRFDHEKTFTSKPSNGREADVTARHPSKNLSEQQSRADAFEEFKRRIDADPYGALFGRRFDRLMHGMESGVWSSLTRSLESLDSASPRSSDSQAGQSKNQALKYGKCEKSPTQDNTQRQTTPTNAPSSSSDETSVKYEYDPISMRNVPKVESMSQPETRPPIKSYEMIDSAVEIPVKKFRRESPPLRKEIVKEAQDNISSKDDQVAGSRAVKSAESIGLKRSPSPRPNGGHKTNSRESPEPSFGDSQRKKVILTPENRNLEPELPLFSGTTYEQKAKSIIARHGEIPTGWLSREGFSTPYPVDSQSIPSSQSTSVPSSSISTPLKIEPALDRLRATKSDSVSRSPATDAPATTSSISVKLSGRNKDNSDLSGCKRATNDAGTVNEVSQQEQDHTPNKIGFTNQQRGETSGTTFANGTSQQESQFGPAKAGSSKSSSIETVAKTVSSEMSAKSHTQSARLDEDFAQCGSLPADRPAFTPKKFSQSGSNNKSSELRGQRTTTAKDSDLSRVSEIAKNIAQKEKLQAEALEEQAKAQARTAALQRAEEQTKTEAEKNEMNLKDLIPVIKGLYEMRYGKVTSEHRQEPHVEANQTPPKKTQCTTVPEIDTAARPNSTLVPPKSYERGDWWQTRRLKRKEGPIPPAQNDTSVIAGAPAQEQQHDYTRFQDTDSHSSPYSKEARLDRKDAHESKPATVASYKVLAYDKSTRRITIADTASSFIHIKEEPLHPTEILSKLNRAAKFLPYLEDLQNDGYEIVSGHGDILIFKRTESAPATNVGKAMSQGHIGATSSMPVEQTEPPPSNPKIRRQEPVFSGSGQTWQEEGSGRPSGSGRLRRITKEVLLTGTVTAGIFYAIGAVSEAMQSDGQEYRGKGRPGIYSTQDSR